MEKLLNRWDWVLRYLCTIGLAAAAAGCGGGGGSGPAGENLLVTSAAGSPGSADTAAEDNTGAVKTTKASVSGLSGDLLPVAAAATLAVEATNSVAPVSWTGTGLANTMAAGCQAPTTPDFLDALIEEARRIEPRPCARVDLSTPIFAWGPPNDRDANQPYVLTVRSANGAVIGRQISTEPRALWAGVPLSAGMYDWSVSYVGSGGRTVRSATRAFEVTPVGEDQRIPSGATVAQMAAQKAHPRLVPAGESFTSLTRANVIGQYRFSYAAFLQESLRLSTTRVANPPDLPDSTTALSTSVGQQSVMQAAMSERQAIESLAIAGSLDGQAVLTRAAVARLVALATWDPNGMTGEAANDQANREIYMGLAIGLDLLGDRLSERQSALVVGALRQRLTQAMAEIDKIAGWPYNSHVVASVRPLAVALLLVAGDPNIPEAQGWAARIWDTWMTTQTTWGADGGFGNGISYAWVDLTLLAPSLAYVKAITGFNMATLPHISGLGDFLINFTAPGAKLRSAFGDGMESTTDYEYYAADTYRLFALLTGSASHQWYWRNHPIPSIYSQPVHSLHYLLWPGAAATLPAPVAPTTDARAYEDTGLVAWHTDVADPQRSSVYFRASRLGSFGHSMADQNAFTLVSKGQPLLITGGYYPYYMSPHHARVGRATEYKNALTIDGGRGQAEAYAGALGNPVAAIGASGRLTNHGEGLGWLVTSGDATAAYRARSDWYAPFVAQLSSATRSLAWHRDAGVLLVFDSATSNTPRSWELNFQALQLPQLTSGKVRLSNGVASACLEVLGPAGNVRLSSGFVIAPENNAPAQHRARWTSSARSTELAAVTVISEDCRDLRASATLTGNAIEVSLGGIKVAQFKQGNVTLYAGAPTP